MSRIVKIFLSTLLYLVGFDLLGVLLCAVFDVASVLPLKLGNTSTMLFYTVWIVDGIFCGLLSYDAGGRIGSEKGPGDWTSREGAGRTGLLVVLVQCVLVAGLLTLCRLFLWQRGIVSGIIAPDNPRLALVFATSTVVSAAVAHFQLRPAAQE
jgi:hypothetical protein